jgi:peptidyl-prolyl cis-trans isomerase C
MTTSFPETKTGLRFGLAALAATGCLAAVLAAGLPVRAQDNPVLAKVNGVEIRQSDSAPAWRRWTRRPRRTTCWPS